MIERAELMRKIDRVREYANKAMVDPRVAENVKGFMREVDVLAKTLMELLHQPESEE